MSLGLLLAAAPSLAAEGTVHYQKETLQEYEKQLAGGQIQAASFNKKVRSIHLTLKDGRHVLVKYAAGQEPTYLAQLRAKGIAVTFLAPAQAAKKAKKPQRKAPDLAPRKNPRGGTSLNYGGIKNDYQP